MIIHHPILGARDLSEFIYIGDAKLINRPEFKGGEAVDEPTMREFYDYTYIRENKAGVMRELWVHKGDHAYLVVTRDTTTHDILMVELAEDVAKKNTPAKGVL